MKKIINFLKKKRENFNDKWNFLQRGKDNFVSFPFFKKIHLPTPQTFKRIMFFSLIFFIIIGVFGVFGVGRVLAETYDLPAYNVDTGILSPIGIVTLITWYVIYIPSTWALSITGSIFNAFLTFSMSREVLNASFVSVAWGALRGIANMLFIFVLVVISISIILDYGKYKSKELIRDVIIIALFVNFSLFAARIVIDAGNIVALGFYDALTIESPKYEPVSNISNIQEKDVSGSLIQFFNPAKMVSPELFNSWKDKNSDSFPFSANSALILVFLMGAALNLYVAYLFFMAGFLFIARVAYLWVIMATGPLAFISYLIPQLQTKVWKQWWEDLIDKSFCIAMFLFWIWLTLMITGSGFLNTLFASSGGEGVGFVRFLVIILLQFMIVVTLLGKSIKHTKKMCDDGGLGAFAFGLVSAAGTAALGAATGGVGIAMRQGVGGWAQRKSEEIKESGGGTTRLGRLGLTTLRNIGGKKFGTEEGYKQRTERVEKEELSYIKSLKKPAQAEYVKNMENRSPLDTLLVHSKMRMAGEKSASKTFTELDSKESLLKENKKTTKDLRADIQEHKYNADAMKKAGNFGAEKAARVALFEKEEKIRDLESVNKKTEEEIKTLKEKTKKAETSKDKERDGKGGVINKVQEVWKKNIKTDNL